jgi:hypothetical protein
MDFAQNLATKWTGFPVEEKKDVIIAAVLNRSADRIIQTII